MFYRWFIASVIFIFEARQAGIPALSRFIKRQKPKAARKAHGESSMPAVNAVSPFR